MAVMVYLDTNVLSEVAKDFGLVSALSRYLGDQNAGLALSGVHLIELQAASRIHDDVADLLCGVNVAVLRQDSEITELEIETYSDLVAPNDVVLDWMPASVGGPEIKKLLSSSSVREARNTIRANAKQMKFVLDVRKGNFATSNDGRYRQEQAAMYEYCTVTQRLAKKSRALFEARQSRGETTDIQCFKSLRLPALVAFYKYYLGGRDPKDSDFADLGHLPFFPYCRTVVTERDLAEVLRQIRVRSNVLDGVDVYDIDFIRRLPI